MEFKGTIQVKKSCNSVCPDNSSYHDPGEDDDWVGVIFSFKVIYYTVHFNQIELARAGDTALQGRSFSVESGSNEPANYDL